ncbi:Probable cysteine desulfurase [uncultured Flavonifractor sp.]|uniref:Aminotransferase class V-fold PLP-dependent enzyme n=1 Tax=Flintibacter hominis TaxID=2763048 RepID=A0A8J6J8A1_9FIRM|nr:aminotransferase class V-fold PLP-dependent enzyme [Flintibacter hominis]SCH74666.1 Probable cysteine desulfurase [uncultured Clostridium sp.]SCI59923.1 Probable cysteine desulfurase [uncultured Flavonifractor sp.]
MIYLDSAATTLQKPPSVARATAHAIDHLASPGRGGHRPAMAAADTAFACREEAAALFHVTSVDQVVFTFNATHGLNIAIKTLVHPGDRVVISGYEHNAVTRPLHAIPEVEILVARSPLFDRQGMIDSFRRCLDQGADAAICTHVSNVFGFILPIQEIAELCRQREVPLIVDASQSAGVLPLDIQELGAAFVAMPGHKGLYGPQGTGLLLCNRDPTPILEGGTGSESLKQSMPQFLPDRLEAGTHNIAGVAGLLEGLRFLRRRDIRWIAGHESRLIQRMGNGLSRLPGVEVFQASMPKAQSGVLSFRIKGRDCEDVGEALGDRGFALRAGLHCAPEAHRTAGTLETGTVRASVSAFNTEMEIDRFLRAIGDMVRR